MKKKAVYDRPRPASLGPSVKLTPGAKSKAKTAARAAGRTYPNLVDNMRVARGRA